MKVKKEEFINDYNTMNIEKMRAKYGGVSRGTLIRLAAKLGIAKNPGRQKKIELID